MIKFATAFVAGVLWSGVALAAKCETMADAKTEAMKPNSGITFTSVDADETSRMVAALKAAHADFKDLKATRIGVLHATNSRIVVLMAYDEKGCTFRNWPVYTSYFFEVIQGKGI